MREIKMGEICLSHNILGAEKDRVVFIKYMEDAPTALCIRDNREVYLLVKHLDPTGEMDQTQGEQQRKTAWVWGDPVPEHAYKKTKTTKRERS
ncbi:hypothetical protein ACTFSJ_27650 [Bacillus cereus group sp. MYBK12-2]|uniref:hypothetical protein n=1 Tax=Bacillus cereus group sp. MYBK12-2 TaxID=3450689 RepID=UPI0032F8F9ED|nr:hypothetical protein [Bacillus pacificus]HDR7653547.1 hypothetical protein [Bacillus pacificus]